MTSSSALRFCARRRRRREDTVITCASHARATVRNDAEAAEADCVARGSEALMAAVGERQDHFAFAQLFDRFAPRIEAYLRRLGAEKALAEDLTQDVMLVLWQRAGLYDPTRAAAATWIFTIARNRFIDSVRRRPSELEADVYAIGVPADDDTERSFYLTQLERNLRRAVALLPSEQNHLIEQGYFLDKSQAALADEFDLPLGTVKSRQRLALGKLRRHLDSVR
jgi:RNA polymerase sigma factor (sigma-70 family)